MERHGLVYSNIQWRSKFDLSWKRMTPGTKLTAILFFTLTCIVCPAQNPLSGLEKFHRGVFSGFLVEFHPVRAILPA